ncbi:SURF1 family protein [Vreelandella andesensis]|uniref:SURF1-like protein n=1 Tax=Vreelandella andesensis TaxID=447567 RepID=A0A3S0Z1L5_9GAMM|nr:SURF1 family protein [Halomonas andesensis]RUR34733.1 SURF1 family protein [Halomonas andesensis]
MAKTSSRSQRLYVWCVFWSVLISLGVLLGLWQWERAADKRVLIAAREAAPLVESPTDTPQEGSELHLQGVYLARHTLYLDNRIVDGRLGVAVLTPFRDSFSQLWLIQRGFIETGPSRAAPHVETPVGSVTVSGEWQVARPGGPLYGENKEGIRLQQISLTPWESTLPAFTYTGWLHADQGEGVFTPWWEASVMPPSRHLGYAFQWWGLALVAAVVMVLGGYRLHKDRLTGD